MQSPDSIVVITRRTALEELIARFNTRSQAQFYLEQNALQTPGVSAPAFSEYQAAHDVYQESLGRLKLGLPREVKTQFVERTHLPNFQFGEKDLVIIIGPDGLVINTAKYLDHQPILAFNPDPRRVDGVLTPFLIFEAKEVIERAMAGEWPVKPISMAQARLNDGQCLHAVNDLFIGARTHVSARYRIEFGATAENHCSSGIIVSTGAGSTGWLSSISGGALQIANRMHQQGLGPPVSGSAGARAGAPPRNGGGNPLSFDGSSPFLYFVVREPFVSKTSSANVVLGKIESGSSLVLTSQMPENGVIFSDGIEADFIQFNSGAVATITVAERQANLLVRQWGPQEGR